jgi:hypothetical protein
MRKIFRTKDLVVKDQSRSRGVPTVSCARSGRLISRQHPGHAPRASCLGHLAGIENRSSRNRHTNALVPSLFIFIDAGGQVSVTGVTRSFRGGAALVAGNWCQAMGEPSQLCWYRVLLRLRVLHVLELLDEFPFALGVFRSSHVLVRLPQQVVRD